MARHLFRCWPQVASRIRSARVLRLFLDFDGTLAHLSPTPGEVTLSAGTRRALRRLSHHERVHVAIVSGRRRADLRRRVSLPRLQYWGLYGWERRPGRSLPLQARTVVSRARDRITSLVEELPGVWVEDKGLAFSVHTRGASARATRQARDCLRRVLAHYEAYLHILPGDRVWNVLPRQVPGKGPAVRQAIERLRTTFLPVCIGDDATDESAFLILNRGITVRVGPARPTHARYRLSDPDDVLCFIERLDEALSTPPHRPG